MRQVRFSDELKDETLTLRINFIVVRDHNSGSLCKLNTLAQKWGYANIKLHYFPISKIQSS